MDAPGTPTPGTPTPDPEREARIAELAARRRARMRTLARRSAFLAAAVCGLVVLGVWWLLNTIAGRDVLLAQIVARLPAGTELTWERAEGPASGPLVLHGLRVVHRACPDVDGEPVAWPDCGKAEQVTVFTAQRAVLDPALRPLLGKRLRLDALDVQDATLALPASDEPFELPQWPESLPEIAPPLALQADTIRIDRLRITSAGERVVMVHSVRGGLDASDGRLHVERLVADTDRGRFTLHGDYVPSDDYRMDLTASALLPAPAGRTRARLGLVARGDVRALDVALAGRAPGPVRARLRLDGEAGDDARPRWRIDAQSEAIALASLTGADEDLVPYALKVQASGTGGRMRVQGEARHAEQVIVVRPSNVTVEGQVLALAPLSVELMGGVVEANGRADFNDPAKARFDGTVAARGVRWQGEQPDAVAVTGDGTFRVSGRLDGWTAQGRATLLREQAKADVQLEARGTAERADIRRVRVATPGGLLDGSGQVTWAPALAWQADVRLADFDPGYLFPDWGGALRGRVRSTGATAPNGVLAVKAEATDLGGRVRGRAIAGRADATLRVPPGEDARIDGSGTVALTIGGSRVDARGRVADVLDIDARFAPLRLDDLMPGAAGELRGTVKATGARTRPDIAASLSGSGLRWDDYTAGTLRAEGRLPWAGGTGTLVLEGTDVQAGLAMGRVRVDARGAFTALEVEADADTEVGAIALSGDAVQRNGQWSGTLATLRLQPTTGGAWALQRPARFAQSGARWTLSPSCFATGAVVGGELCASADWPTRVDVRGEQVPLALLAPYLPERDGGGAWLLRGAVDLDAQVRPRGDSWAGTAQVRSADGALTLDDRSRREVLGYTDLDLEATFDANRLGVSLSGRLQPEGDVQATLSTGWDAYAPLDGRIRINTESLTWLELFSPDIVEPRGRLDAAVTLSGTRAAPVLGGNGQLSAFTADMPALGITLRDGDVRMEAQPDGTARIVGLVRSGDGVLRVDGTLGWLSDDTPLRLGIHGGNVLVSDTRELRAVIDPDVEVRYAAGQPITVTGRVRVASAMMNLEGLSEGVSASPDVVVLDPANPERAGSTPLDMDLVLEMGDDVQLRGFGLEGALTGSLRARLRPGREGTATGTLDVAGRYRAYGQRLEIVRGRMVWSNNAFGNPLLDLRAQRVVGDVTAGIDVTGRASAPVARIWTDPATSESEALAYLALGRPLATASADESRQISGATAALSAGNLLASQLGQKIGLDDAGVSESRALGGSVVGFGKYLSPRLYVSYGVSLLGTGQVVTLRYLLRKGFDIEIETSTLESRASVNWRTER